MTILRRITFRFITLFISLFILFLPFPYQALPDVGGFFSSITKKVVEWVGDSMLRISQPYTSQIISDSTGMYILVLLLLLLALIIALVWTTLDRGKADDIKWKYWFRAALSYYLALQLLIYGADKVFKHQFYLPEPNTLYTPLGHLSRDILYWSTVGSSWSYSFFTGIAEVIPAIMLLFRSMRGLGAALAMLVLLHVVLINFSFDISVKVYSLFLLLTAAVLAAPVLAKIYLLLIKESTVRLKEWRPVLCLQQQVLWYSVGKAVLIGLILFETLSPYFEAGIFQDNAAARPPLHGAYEVEWFVRNNDTIPPLPSSSVRPKRFFIHRRGYFIIQSIKDEMSDYQLDYDLENKALYLSDYNRNCFKLTYQYSAQDSILVLEGNLDGDQIKAKAKQIELSNLPLLQRDFHWTIDDYK